MKFEGPGIQMLSEEEIRVIAVTQEFARDPIKGLKQIRTEIDKHADDDMSSKGTQLLVAISGLVSASKEIQKHTEILEPRLKSLIEAEEVSDEAIKTAINMLQEVGYSKEELRSMATSMIESASWYVDELSQHMELRGMMQRGLSLLEEVYGEDN